MADPVQIPSNVLNAGAPYTFISDPEGHIFGQRDDYFYEHITAAGTVTITNVASHIAHLIIGGVATNPLTVTIYDNTSAAAPVVSVLTVGTLTIPLFLTFNTLFNTGITVVTTQTSGTFDLTIMWRNQS